MKRTYIQPTIDTMVLPQEALMGPIPLAGSGEGPGVGNNAPKRAATPTNPVMPLDSVSVF